MGSKFSASDSKVTSFRYFWWLDTLSGSSLMPEMHHDACFDEMRCGI